MATIHLKREEIVTKTVTTYDVISYLIHIIQKREYLWDERRYEKEKKISFSERAFK